MATRVAAVGGGNWTAGATWVGGVAPTAADDAQLAVTSGNVTIDSGAVARSLDCTGYVGTLTHTAGVNLTLGDGTAGAGNVALKLVAGMTYVLGSFSSAVAYVSTSATQQTITTAGKTMGNFQVNGAGSSYLLGDAITTGTTSTFTLTTGTFNTGNFAMSLGLFVISGASAKTLTLGSSAITITGANGSAVNYSGSNCTFTANTAVMTLTGAGSGFIGSNVNWNGLSIVSSGSGTFFVTSGTVANLTRISTAIKTDAMEFSSGTTFTVTGVLTITGNSAINRMMVRSGTIGTARGLSAGSVVLTNTNFQDITAAGAAIPWTGTSMGNALGNTNITFDAPTTQTNTGATGNWSDVTKWTSRVPLPQDNVVVNTGSGTITADMPRLGADVTFAGFAGTADFASVANAMYGSLVLGSGMTISGTFGTTFSARSAKTITSNGKAFTQSITQAAPGGTYTLTNALSLPGTTQNLTITNGTFASAGFPIASGNFAQSGTASTIVDITNSTVTLSGVSGNVWNVVNAATVLTATGSTIIYAGATATARTFGGNGKTYGTLTYTVPGSTGSLTITGSNTFNTINFSDPTNARSLLFTAGTTTTVTSWNVRGTAGKLMTVDSATAATHTLAKASGTASSDYLSVKNSLAGGGAAWYAGANSTDQGGNTGWQFVAVPAGARWVQQAGPAPRAMQKLAA